MKKLIMALVLALAAAGTAQADDMSGMKMGQAPAKAAVNHTKGVVKALDPAKGTITLSHEAVATLKWPAMTMTFGITPDLAKGIETGQKVDFEFVTQGMAGTITKISVIH
jgi:Cu(I)/Ag(I) efflux system protein CusF